MDHPSIAETDAAQPFDVDPGVAESLTHVGQPTGLIRHADR